MATRNPVEPPRLAGNIPLFIGLLPPSQVRWLGTLGISVYLRLHHPESAPGAEDDASTVFEQQGANGVSLGTEFSQVQICKGEQVKISTASIRLSYHNWQEFSGISIPTSYKCTSNLKTQ